DGEIVPDTKFEKDFPHQKGEEDSVRQGNVQSEDPFNIYELLNHKRPELKKLLERNNLTRKNSKNDVEESNCSGHFKKSEVPKSGGSILQLIDDLVKVGETIVYDMKGCMKNMEDIIELQGANDDYFVMVRGDWMPNGKKLLIISVYAPQELSEKKMLWDYLSLVMSNWEGEEKSHKSKRSLLAKLADCDAIINKGEGENKVVNRRTEVVNLLQEVEKKNYLEAAQKAKVKWAIEGDENSKYYHGMINKKRNQLSIRGILMEVADLECQVSKEEIKKAVWDCGIDKSLGPDGFTFGFYRRYWKLIENDVVDAFKDLGKSSCCGVGGLANEIQSDFMADKQILDGPFILNELVQWCKKKKKQSLVFKVDFEKAYDSVRWDHLDDIMRKFGFGEKLCMWIQSCLRSSRGSVIVNGSPTEEFQFYKGLKQGDPLSPFLFILVMERLHISFQRVVDVGLFKGIELAPFLNLSHMFYADDAIFIEDDKVKQAAAKIGCNTLKTPFSYLGSKVGGCMSRIQS
nr:RNA-directed DNA polymerase, eukaryota, reverse transcriptase zinc-binding domain protein [Tanacetum cinerariifolium]